MMSEKGNEEKMTKLKNDENITESYEEENSEDELAKDDLLDKKILLEENEIAGVTLNESNLLQKYLEKEANHFDQPKRKCELHSIDCPECIILNKNKGKSEEEEKIIEKMSKGQKVIRKEDGTNLIEQTFFYKNDVDKVFGPQHSNMEKARQNTISLITKAKKVGAFETLTNQVQDAVDDGVFEELSPQEEEGLKSNTHNFTFVNYVESPQSNSTKFRLVSNTSTFNGGTSVSLESEAASNSLNVMETSLIRFCLYPIPIFGDLRKAYRAIAVDEKTAMLRLLYWFRDPENMRDPVIYKRKRMDFGDRQASLALEICHSNLIVKECKLEITKYLLTEIRYSDNVVGSVMDQKTFRSVVEDIEQAYKKFGFKLKYIHSSKEYDEEVLKDEARGSDEIELLLGLKYNIVEDTILPNVKFNTFGKKRGKPMGPDLKDYDLKKEEISRLTLSRILPQAFDRCQFMLGPVILSMKILLSKVCEVVPVKDHKKPIMDFDEDLASTIHQFLMNLKRIDTIQPFRRAWILPGFELDGFICTRDGSLAGFGTLIYTASSRGGEKDIHLSYAKSRISKRSIFFNELAAVSLNLEALKEVLEALSFDNCNKKLNFYSLGDSAVISHLFHPNAAIKDTLIKGLVVKIKDLLLNLSMKYVNSQFHLGFISGNVNSADLLSKFFHDPIAKLNSSMYRNCNGYFNKGNKEMENIFLNVKEGTFQFTPLKKSITGVAGFVQSTEKEELVASNVSEKKIQKFQEGKYKIKPDSCKFY